MEDIVQEDRWNQLRAVEAQILRPSSPIPDDPCVTFPKGWMRAAEAELSPLNRIEIELRSRGFLPRAMDVMRNQERAEDENDVTMENHYQEDRHHHNYNLRQNGDRIGRAARRDRPRHNNPNRSGNHGPIPRRPLSPTELPGVRAIPKEYNRMFRGLLTPGEYFAKSHTKYLGPYPQMPTVSNLPADDSYIILQRMGRLPESGKSIFRQVGTLVT